MNNKLKQVFLLVGDVIILYFSLYLTLLIRYWGDIDANYWQAHFWPFSIVFFAWVIIFYISGLYNIHIAINNSIFFRKTGRSLAISGIISVAFFYLTPQIAIAPKRNLLIYIAVFAVLFYLWRQFYNWSLKSYLPKNTVAFIGFNEQVKELIQTIGNQPHLGYQIAFIVDDKKSQALAAENFSNLPIISGVFDLEKYIVKRKVSTVILTTDPHQSQELRNSLFQCLRYKINYINLPDFYEQVTGKIPIEAIGQMWFLENLNEGEKVVYEFVKRFYDIVLALVILVITFPFWFVIALVIKLESRGPVFFLNRRSGRNNKEFKLIKFRTMKEEGNARSLTIKNDPRITKFGNFLRKTRIDEIPQIINILKGEMSFVGPRPERLEFIKELQTIIPFYQERMLVKPGLTGSDQISGEYHSPSREDTLKKLQYDLFYIKNRSVYLDLSIILKTIYTVLSRGGR